MKTLFGEEIIPEELSAAPKAEATGEASQTSSILEGWEPKKQYYSIGEVAALFDVRTSNIRYWTTEFELHVRTTRKGDRLYTPASIQQLRTIYHLVKERGFTIAGAKAHMQQSAGMPETIDLRQALLRLRNQLISIRNELL